MANLTDYLKYSKQPDDIKYVTYQGVGATSDDSGKDDSKKNPPAEIRGKINSYQQSEFPIYHRYTSLGEKQARVSGNLSALGLVGHLMSKNLATNQLVDVTLNPKIVEISPSCFAECKNLVHIDAGNNVKSVGDYAFYKCENLSGVSFLASDNKVLTRIGDYAFAGSGLKSIKLNLQGSVADSSINTHRFADCKQLTSVEMINSTYLADHMFDGCDSLTNVKLNNYHSYVNPYAFANCRTLAKMQIPANIYMLSPHMFEGCTNLTSIEFQSGSQLRQLGECVFSGCTKLTSITLPASINDLDYIDPRFLSGSNVQRLEFKGLTDDVFINETYKRISVDYETHKWYSSPKKTIEGLMNICHENHLPMIVNLGNSASLCGRCKTWEKNVIDKESWKTWFNNSQYFYVHAQNGIDRAAYYAASNFIASKTRLAVPGRFPRIYVYWNKLNDDGTATLIADGGDGVADPDFNSAASLIAKAKKSFAGYEGLSSYSYELKSQITTFGLGSGKKITYVSSTGKEYECSNDYVAYTPEVKVDKVTKSNFKFGTWYGNARELVAAADATGVPVLAEFGSIACDPCIDFRKNTFNNSTFQKEITSLPVLLCKVEIGEGESFDYPPTTQANWISHNFGSPKSYIPQLIFYWNPPKAISTSSPYKEIWNYNYRSDAANANYQTVLNKVDKMLNHFAGGKAWLASISSSFEGKTIYTGETGKYLYYKNESGDYDGRYFVCDSKTRIQSWNQAVLSIKNEDELTPIMPLDQLCSTVDPILQDFQMFSDSDAKPTSYTTDGAYSVFSSIAEDDIVKIAKATYQCFTAPADVPNTNLSGVIFKVSEMSAVNDRAVKFADGNWKYLDDTLVDSGDVGSISLKNGVEYLYKFLNEDSDIPDSPKDDDWPLGTWIEASETTAKDSFDAIWKDSEEDSSVLVIAEDLKTHEAQVTLEDGTSDTLRIDLSGVQLSDVEKAVKDAFAKVGKTVSAISNLDYLKVVANFKQLMTKDSQLRKWMKGTEYRFLLVQTDDWSRGFPQALRQFEEEVNFEGNSPTDRLPKILVYHGCSTCVISGVALYCRKKIAVDQVRDSSTYYSGLIDAYAALDDDYIWSR